MARKDPPSPLSRLEDEGALIAVYHLYRHGEPVSMSAFSAVTGRVHVMAARLRDRMLEHGLITVTHVRTQGPVEVQRIELTDIGRRIGKRLAAIDNALRRAANKGDKP